MFDLLSDKFSHVLNWMKGRGRLTDEMVEQALEQVKEALLEADVPHGIITDFLEMVKKDVVGQKLSSKVNPGDLFIKAVYEKTVEFLGGTAAHKQVSFQIPSIIMHIGLQGSGKTTTLGKLAYRIKKDAEKRGKSRKILLASVDYYRPAAREQLRILAEQVGVDYYESSYSDAVSAAKDIHNYYKNNRYDHLLFDTAGRLHIDQELMSELSQISKLLSPQYKILVLDAMTGQQSLAVAKSFQEQIGFHGAIMSKMDSDTRAGAAFAFRYSLKKPLWFLGVGEKIEDLEGCIAERMASRIIGMGDIMTLIEKTEEKIDVKSQEHMTKRLLSGNLTLEDFASQIDMVGKMGTLQSLMRYMPGMPNMSAEQIDGQQREMKKFRAIISSMTKKERLAPQILDRSRKERVAKGSGVQMSDINQLLDKFEQSKQLAKMMKKMGPMGRFFK